MAKSFQLSIVAPDRNVAELEVESVTVPGIAGYFGVWAGHEPIIAALKPGIIEFLAGGGRQYASIGGGFAEVSPTNVTILADDAQLATEIDLAKAELDLEEALRALKGEVSTMTTGEAADAVERAMFRIRAAKKSS